MIYNYICPGCGWWRIVGWRERAERRKCHLTGRLYVPPSPTYQHYAFVDSHEWPLEMEVAALAARGKSCTVPGCFRLASTLDHRIPWSKGGVTSVLNLHPMCEQHNLAKGDLPYDFWLATRPDSPTHLRSLLLEALLGHRP